MCSKIFSAIFLIASWVTLANIAFLSSLNPKAPALAMPYQTAKDVAHIPIASAGLPAAIIFELRMG